MKPSTRSRYRWVRLSVLLMALVTSVALLATGWSSYATVQRTSETVVRGQGDAVFHAVMQSLWELDQDLSQADLETMVAAQKAAGLCFLASFNDLGEIVHTAGTSSAAPAALRDTYESAMPGMQRRIGNHVLMVLRPPPDEPPGDDRERQPPPHDRRGPPPRLLIEFEPFVAQRLAGEARAVLVVSIVAAGVLIAGGIIAWRMILRAEILAQRSEQEARLAALGTMSAVMAHEIRNPLASLKGHAQLLLEACSADDPRHSQAQQVVTETMRLESLTARLLDFARGDQLDLQRVAPAQLVERACNDCADVQFNLCLKHAPQEWVLDPLRMQQVLVNLIRNAAAASPEGAAVDVGVANTNGHLLITVRDQGQGFPDQGAERLFDPFVTTRVRGTGLGLAIAKSIIELHDGEIRAHNHPSGGAVVELKIPPGELS